MCGLGKELKGLELMQNPQVLILILNKEPRRCELMIELKEVELQGAGS